MFGGMDWNNYEDRKVGRYHADGIFVSTAAVTDSKFPFETAVKDGDGKVVVVENYNTKEEAIKGHEKWVGLMTSENPPKDFSDVGGSFLKDMFQ